MGDLTADLPKPMLPLGGSPMIDRAIKIGREAQASKIVANLHYLANKLQPHLEGQNVETITEAPHILDTGGGLKAAASRLTSPTFTLNSDALWSGPNPLILLEKAWRENDEVLLLVVPRQKATNREGPGDFTLESGILKRGGDYVYTGAQLIRTEVLADESGTVFSLNQVWDKIAARGKLRGVEYPGSWIDIGTSNALAAAEDSMKRGDV